MHSSVVAAAQAAVAAAIATIRPSEHRSGNSSSLGESHKDLLQHLVDASIAATAGSEALVLPALPSTPARPRTAGLSMAWSEMEGAALDPSPNSSSDLASPSQLATALAAVREKEAEPAETVADGSPAESPLSDQARSLHEWSWPQGGWAEPVTYSSKVRQGSPQPMNQGLHALLSPRVYQRQLLPCQAGPRSPGGSPRAVSPQQTWRQTLQQPVRAIPPLIQQQADALLRRRHTIVLGATHPAAYMVDGRSRSPSPRPDQVVISSNFAWGAIASEALSPQPQSGGTGLEALPMEDVSFSRTVSGTASATDSATGSSLSYALPSEAPSELSDMPSAPGAPTRQLPAASPCLIRPQEARFAVSPCYVPAVTGQAQQHLVSPRHVVQPVSICNSIGYRSLSPQLRSPRPSVQSMSAWTIPEEQSEGSDNDTSDLRQNSLISPVVTESSVAVLTETSAAVPSSSPAVLSSSPAVNSPSVPREISPVTVAPINMADAPWYLNSEWANKLEPASQVLLAPPDLPPLQELFERNMREQNEERLLRQRQQMRKQRSLASGSSSDRGSFLSDGVMSYSDTASVPLPAIVKL